MKKNLSINFLSRLGWFSFLFHLIVISNFYLITNNAKCYATNYVGGMTELLTVLSAPNTNTFTATSDITLTQSLGLITGTSLSLFGNNSKYGLNGSSTYSGINVSSGQTLNISNFGSVNSSGTVVDSISNFNKTASGTIIDATTSGAVAYNTGTVSITNSVFSSNNAYAGGVLYNAGTETISKSTFNANTSTYGGAIYNSGTSIITNSIFTNNTASTSGGAIYNANSTSYLDIIADKGATSFTGNNAGGVSNAIYMNGGMLNLNAGNGGYILFNDKISSLNSSSIININKTGTGLVDTGYMPATAPTNGNVIFNNTVSDATLNLYAGMLTLGKYGNTLANYLSNDTLTLSGGGLNSVNDIIDTNNLTNLTSVAAAGLYLDANLSNGNSDRLNVSGTGSGNLTIKGINILADGTSNITVVNGASSPALTTTSLTAYSNGYKYQFTNPSAGVLGVSSQTAASGFGGLYDAVSDATAGRTNRSFSATGDVTLSCNLGSLGLANSTLTIFGNQKNINGLNGGTNYTGIIVSFGQTLNIYDAGSLDGSGNILTSINNLVKPGSTDNSTCDGGVVYNSGTTNIRNSVFSANRGYNGGVLYNPSIGSFTINNSDFENNIASGSGGVIYNAGTANIINSIFKGNQAPSIAGGVIYNYQSAGSILNITGSTFENNSAVFGGAIINRTAARTTITGSQFTSNNANTQGGAIYSETTGTVTDTDSIYTNNTATSGGAIYNTGTTNLTNDTFTNNGITSASIIKSTQGGAIYNYNSGGVAVGTITATDSIFNGNIASSQGGAIYSNAPATATTATTTVNINNCKFGNLATNKAISSTTIATSAYGGAIYSSASTVAASTAVATSNNNISNNSIFNGNIASASTTNANAAANAYGGAIYNTATTASTTASATATATQTISDTTFTNNNANASTTGTGTATAKSYGGAIYNTASTTSVASAVATINVTNSTFTGNTATGTSTNSTVNTYGGAIYNTQSASGGGTATATVTLTNSTFNSNTAATSGGAVYNSGTTTISGSTFSGNSAANGGAIYNTGTATLTDTNFTNNTASTSGGAIYNTGTLNIKASAGGATSFSGNTANNVSNAMHLAGGTVNLNAGNNGTITFADKITSSSSSNVININGTADAALNSGTINFNNTVSNSTINLYNGTLALGNDSNINGNNLALNGGTLNLINNSAGTMSLNSLALTGTTNLKIDADLANSTADKITSATPVTGTGVLNVSKVNLLSDSTTAKNISIADASIKNYVQVSASTAESALYKYNLSYDSSNGTMGFVNTHQFTPSILTPQVAATVGTYLTQTATYHEVFNNVDTLMFMPRSDRLLMQQNNKIASADDNFVFSPTFLPEQSKGLWFKQFTTFENVPLNNGPNVSNVGYGALIGGDTELQYLGHGYSGYMTAYTGYNGSHQNYNSVGTYQNGGLLGLTGTIYKGNFFAALTANIGASNANANTTTGTDNFTMLTAGTAVKTGYNVELFNGKFIIQPSYTMSYTFAKTFDYTTSSGANITSDPLNAIQISPGIKFIGNLKNGWQPYTGVSMVWNIMDSQRFYANEVQLPQLSIAPYVEYGVGLQRKWGEKLTGFAQTMLRGGGRNGIALQFGFRWAIGK